MGNGRKLATAVGSLAAATVLLAACTSSSKSTSTTTSESSGQFGTLAGTARHAH